MTDLATSPKLLEKLSAAARRTLSGAEVRSQKISYILGAVNDDSTITREQVEKVVKHLEGQSAA